MPITLSVVLPNYNHARLIGRALTALLTQERPPDEIVIIDDGSTDDSLKVIEDFASKAPSIRVLPNPRNIGVIPTLTRGLEAAQGKYIYFAAADDYVLPGFFELALRRLEADGGIGLFCGEAVLIDGRHGRPFAVRPAVRPLMRAGRLGPEKVEKLLHAADNWILTGSAVFRRDLAVQAGGFDARLGSTADGLLGRKIALRSGLFFEPKVVAAWVVFPDSVSRTTALDAQRAQHILRTVPELIAADPGFPAWYAQAYRDRWRFNTCRLALQATPIDRDFLLGMAASTPAGRAQLDRILALPSRRLTRLAALAYLWYRLRPTALTALLRTMLAMRTPRLIAGFRFRQFQGKGARASSSGR